MKERNREIRKPRQSRGKESYNKILRAAHRLFVQYGYQGINTKDIAREAGLSIGGLYAYFSDKGDIFYTLVEQTYQEIFTKVRVLMENFPSYIERKKMIETLVYAIHKAHTIEPELHREMSLMVLAGSNSQAPDSTDQRLFFRISQYVEEMDRMVLSWLTGKFIQWGLSQDRGDVQAVAALVFRTTEETIHRLNQFPCSLGEPETILRQLILMLDSYLSHYFPEKLGKV